MAEAVGLAASVIQVAATGLKLSQALYQYADTVSNADRRIADIAKEVKLTSFVINELGDIFKQSVKLLSPGAITTAGDTIQECKDVFNRMGKEVTRTKKNGFGKLPLPFREPKINLLRSHLDMLKITLQLLMQVLSHAHDKVARENRRTEVAQREEIKALLLKKKSSTKRYEESLRDYKTQSSDTEESEAEELGDKRLGARDLPNDSAVSIAQMNTTITAITLESAVSYVKGFLEDIERLQQALAKAEGGTDHSNHQQNLIGSYLRTKEHLDQVFLGNPQKFRTESNTLVESELTRETSLTGSTLRASRSSSLIETQRPVTIAYGDPSRGSLTEAIAGQLKGEYVDRPNEPSEIERSELRSPQPPPARRHQSSASSLTTNTQAPSLYAPSPVQNNQGQKVDIWDMKQLRSDLESAHELVDSKERAEHTQGRPRIEDHEGVERLALREKVIKEEERRAKREEKEKFIRNAAYGGQAALSPPKSPEGQRAAVIKLTDALGRKFTFPFQIADTWIKLNGLIIAAFRDVENLKQQVMESRYNLIGPSGRLLEVHYYNAEVKPGWFIEMKMWEKHASYALSRPFPPIASRSSRPVMSEPDLPSSRYPQKAVTFNEYDSSSSTSDSDSGVDSMARYSPTRMRKGPPKNPRPSLRRKGVTYPTPSTGLAISPPTDTSHLRPLSDNGESLRKASKPTPAVGPKEAPSERQTSAPSSPSHTRPSAAPRSELIEGVMDDRANSVIVRQGMRSPEMQTPGLESYSLRKDADHPGQERPSDSEESLLPIETKDTPEGNIDTRGPLEPGNGKAGRHDGGEEANGAMKDEYDTSESLKGIKEEEEINPSEIQRRPPQYAWVRKRRPERSDEDTSRRREPGRGPNLSHMFFEEDLTDGDRDANDYPHTRMPLTDGLYDQSVPPASTQVIGERIDLQNDDDKLSESNDSPQRHRRDSLRDDRNPRPQRRAPQRALGSRPRILSRSPRPQLRETVTVDDSEVDDLLREWTTLT